MSTRRDTRMRGMLGRGGVIALGCLLALALIVAQSAQAWLNWRVQEMPTLTQDLQEGDAISVMLMGGQIFYGAYVGTDGRYLKIKDVYYVQSFVDPATNNQGNRLVSRSKADWHSPDLTVIALDKAVMVERVGKQSRLLQLIEQDQK